MHFLIDEVFPNPCFVFASACKYLILKFADEIEGVEILSVYVCR